MKIITRNYLNGEAACFGRNSIMSHNALQQYYGMIGQFQQNSSCWTNIGYGVSKCWQFQINWSME